MRLRVLGCSGGIGGRHLRTTSFLVDSDILIDAGTGVGDLTLAELSQIDHIFVTHSHLDHVASIPFLVDTIGGMRTKPIEVYTQRATIEILRNHLFNWAIWPDFTEIPTPEAPFLRYQEIVVGPGRQPVGRTITPHSRAPHRSRGRLPPRQRRREPGLHRRHRAERRALERGEPHRQPQVPDHRDCVLEQGAPPRGDLAPSLSGRRSPRS